MEEQARDLGVVAISLQVFKHNPIARAMYEKLDSLGEAEMMMKRLVTETD
jgi:ribosomal protein S18 acetylase RimI-like enzyme